MGKANKFIMHQFILTTIGVFCGIVLVVFGTGLVPVLGGVIIGANFVVAVVSYFAQ